MSRTGKKPIALPSGVSATIAAGNITVKGPKGQLEQSLVRLVSVSQDGDSVVVLRDNDSKPARANHGLMRSLINNMVEGVSNGFSKSLLVQGVGYRADVKGGKLVMALGYSHPIEYVIPNGVSIEADKTNKITVSGIDKQQVGQVAAVIRGFRKPDHYKGKGVRYEGEYVRLKAGKSS